MGSPANPATKALVPGGSAKIWLAGNLTIVVNDEESFSASDRFANKSPSPNVGEFEVQEIVSNLPIDHSVKLVLPLRAENSVEIFLPPPVILEWQELAKS